MTPSQDSTDFDPPGEFEIEGQLSIDGTIEATQLAIRVGHGCFSVSDALKKNPKREVILYPFLRNMLSCEYNEYLGDGVRYSFKGNRLGVYTYQFRGEGDFKRVKEWSLVVTYRKSISVLVEIEGKTNPDIEYLREGKYDTGLPEMSFSIQFIIPEKTLQRVLNISDTRFRYIVEKLSKQADELP